LALLHGDYLIGLTRICFQELDWYSVELFEMSAIIHQEAPFMGNQEGVHRLQFHAKSSFQICSTDRHFEVVSISATINVETPLIGLVADTIFDFGAEHQLVASHIIGHNIIQSSFTFITVNFVEVYLLVGGDLEAHVAFDVVDQSSHVFDNVVLFPGSL